MKKAKVPRPKTDAQILLEIHLKELGLEFMTEYKFHPKREWRFDYYIVKRGVANFVVDSWAVEIEGGIWTRGRHTRGKGYLSDMEKYREAAASGIKVFRFATQEVLDGTARAFIAEHCV